MNAAADLPTLRMPDVVMLYQWATEMMTRPDCKSPLGALYSSTRRVSEWSGRDFRDLAESIVGSVGGLRRSLADAGNADFIKVDFFRVIAGPKYDERDSLASVLAQRLQRSPVADGKPYGKISAIAKQAIIWRTAMIHDRKAPGLNGYAFALGIKRQSLDDAGWRLLIREAEHILCEWFDSGERLVEQKLHEAGLWDVSR